MAPGDGGVPLLPAGAQVLERRTGGKRVTGGTVRNVM